MKNNKSFNSNPFDFHLAIVKSKHKRKKDTGYKERIELLNPKISDSFKLYTTCFNNNSLTELKPIGFIGQNKSDLLQLYKYSSKPIQDFKKWLLTDDNGRENNICLSCLFNEISTFDHYLPSSEFPEYIVNPLNLIPSCGKCNEIKNQYWKGEDNNRLFVNPYVDIIPKEQFLFVRINLIKYDRLLIEFYLQNKCNNIDSGLFDIIKNHFVKLDLFNRYSINSDSIISELSIHILKSLQNQIPIETIVNIVNQECEEHFEKLGRNNWRWVLKQELINNNQFIDFVCKS